MKLSKLSGGSLLTGLDDLTEITYTHDSLYGIKIRGRVWSIHILKILVNQFMFTVRIGESHEDPFWTKAETLLYCALVGYIVFEGPEEERNLNTLVEMINSMDVKEDDESFKNAVDYMFDGLEKRKPDSFAVRQYAKYKLASGIICSKRYLNHVFPKVSETN